MNRILIALGAVLLFSGCEKSQPKPQNINQLVDQLTEAIDDSNLDRHLSLYQNGEELSKDQRAGLRKFMKEVRRIGYDVSVVDYIPKVRNSTGFDPEYYVSLRGFDGVEGEVGTMSVSYVLASGSDGERYFFYRNVDECFAKALDDSVRMAIKVITPDQLKLMNVTEHTFMSSWNGRDFRSYSMAGLAQLLSKHSKYSIEDHTGLSGDYDFSLPLRHNYHPSNIQIELNRLGLRMVEINTPPTEPQAVLEP